MSKPEHKAKVYKAIIRKLILMSIMYVILEVLDREHVFSHLAKTGELVAVALIDHCLPWD